MPGTGGAIVTDEDGEAPAAVNCEAAKWAMILLAEICQRGEITGDPFASGQPAAANHLMATIDAVDWK